MDPAKAAEFRFDLCTAQQKFKLGVCSGSDKSSASHWERWRTFCASLAIDPLLSAIQDLITLLPVFAVRYRIRQISGNRIRGRTVEGRTGG